MYLLKTLSPLHIGNGEQYSSFEYLLENNKIIIYKYDNIANKILKANKSEEIIDNLKNEKIRNLKDLIEKYKLKLDENDVFEKVIYKGNKFPTNIQRFITQNNLPYIPATEIKGAIRTALISFFIVNYYKKSFLKEIKKLLNNDIDQYFQIKKEIIKLRNKGKNNKDSELQEKFKEISKIKKQIFNKTKKFYNNFVRSKLSFLNNDSKYDIMKLFLFEDSLDINSKDKLINTVFVSNIGKPKYINCELVRSNLSIYFPKYLFKISSLNKYLEMLNIMEKQQNNNIKIFIDFLKQYNTEDKILKLVSDYYIRLANYEEFQVKLNKNEYLIRIGRFKGFLSNTIWLPFLNEEREFFGKFFESIAPRGYENNPAKSKKSILGSREQLGWCKIIKNNNIGKIEKKSKPATQKDLEKLAVKFKTRR